MQGKLAARDGTRVRSARLDSGRAASCIECSFSGSRNARIYADKSVSVSASVPAASGTTGIEGKYLKAGKSRPDADDGADEKDELDTKTLLNGCIVSNLSIQSSDPDVHQQISLSVPSTSSTPSPNPPIPRPPHSHRPQSDSSSRAVPCIAAVAARTQPWCRSTAARSLSGVLRAWPASDNSFQDMFL